jgi:hypothetical protein
VLKGKGKGNDYGFTFLPFTLPCRGLSTSTDALGMHISKIQTAM